MTIVLNEHEWAEEMITSRSLGKKPYETLCRVARYYLDNGIPKKEVRRMLDTFLIQCDPTASLPRWSNSLDAALAHALKYEAIELDGVDITKPEMERIDALQGKQTRRLAFTLLCLAKYWNTVSKKTDGWVNSKDSEIMRMANINTSIKRQSLMFHSLNECGMIQFSRKVDNTNVRVCFIEDGDVVLHIFDFRNLGYQYLKYHGGDYFICENCGVTEKMNNPDKGRPQKYCRECANKIDMQRRIRSIRDESSRRDGDYKRYKVYLHQFPDGKVYIGSTSQELKDRWRNGTGYRGLDVWNAIREVGWENVRHYVLFDGIDRESARFIESYMIRKKKSYMSEYGYNVKDKTSCMSITDVDPPEYLNIEVDGNGRKIA